MNGPLDRSWQRAHTCLHKRNAARVNGGAHERANSRVRAWPNARRPADGRWPLMLRAFIRPASLLVAVASTATLTCPSTAAAQAAGSPEAQAAARTDPSWAPPHTPWGHPDLQGIWTTDDMRGIPQQRAPEFGTRPHLTDEEYAEREAQRERARQTQDRGASGTFRNEEGTRSFSYTSLVIDPPDGRIPPMLAAATRAALDARLVRPRAVQQRSRLQSLRSLHHARRRSARSRRPCTATARASCRRRTPWPSPTRWFTTRGSFRSTAAPL